MKNITDCKKILNNKYHLGNLHHVTSSDIIHDNFFNTLKMKILFNFFYLVIRCGCDECVTSRQEDSLRHSRSRINAYRALASPSLIALSSKDPILTAFELSWELRRLSFLEHEFKVSKNLLKFVYF